MKNSAAGMMNWDEQKIAVIGLGYVGLPLAVEFGKTRKVVGYDLNQARIAELAQGNDRTLEVSADQLSLATNLAFTTDRDALKDCGIFIVTVPTPIDKANRPDLGPLRSASALVGNMMPEGALVIFESTVYPGCTEEVCVPVIEGASGRTYNQGFFCGYSPERINPGDKTHRLVNIMKVTSGSTDEVAEVVDRLYAAIIAAGTHKAPSIKVAEAAKVIENTQRDLNIALMNELSLIFNKLGIDTEEVLTAAGTKWNFLPFRPGLVGGHCIGVDPYYLTHKAQEVGYHPEVILAGRRINDRMGGYVAERVVKAMLHKGSSPLGAKILVLGLTFKENCPDIRNTRVIDIVDAFTDYGMGVEIFDPWVDLDVARHEFGLECLTTLPENGGYSAIVVAVGHQAFVSAGAIALRALGRENAVLFDVKSVFDRESTDGRL